MNSVRPNFGPFATEAEALEAVVSRIVGAVDPEAVWLFGSRARGEARPDSDFDLLVVGKPGSPLGSDDYEKVDRPLHGLGIGCDVVPCAAEDFAEALELNTSFVTRIVGEGRKVYEAVDGCKSPARDARRQLPVDFAQTRKIRSKTSSKRSVCRFLRGRAACCLGADRFGA